VLRSIKLDPKFRNDAASRLLGTMYVVAPSSFVEHGDSEQGLELLEGLVDEYPGDAETDGAMGAVFRRGLSIWPCSSLPICGNSNGRQRLGK
jgi:hypothetical protein